jgi:hypothetical protein
MVEVESKISVLASMDRKVYMGSCRLGWERMMQMRRPLPTRAVMYMVQKGMESQMCRCSSPGMPVRKQPAARVSELFIAAVLLANKKSQDFLQSLGHRGKIVSDFEQSAQNNHQICTHSEALQQLRV